MKYDMRTVPLDVRYRLLSSTIVPRPIAWITSRDKDGRVNLAPFSYFNLMGHNPPVIALGFAASPLEAGRFKDTPENIMSTGEFVVHLVPEADAQAMNLTSMEAPSHIDESRVAALDLVPSDVVAAPRLAKSPIAFECIRQTTLLTGRDQLMIVGQVVYAHLDDQLLVNKERGLVATEVIGLIARMHGTGYYARTSDLFQMERPAYADHSPHDLPAKGDV